MYAYGLTALHLALFVCLLLSTRDRLHVYLGEGKVVGHSENAIQIYLETLFDWLLVLVRVGKESVASSREVGEGPPARGRGKRLGAD
jgi:hypothetical protein